MGIAKKGKRQITVDDADYYWFVSDDFNVLELGTDKSLKVSSEDKTFLVRYPLNQILDGQNLLIVIGSRFGGEGSWGKGWQRVLCPRFEHQNQMTPSSVAELIKWALSEKDNVFVDYRGISH